MKIYLYVKIEQSKYFIDYINSIIVNNKQILLLTYYDADYETLDTMIKSNHDTIFIFIQDIPINIINNYKNNYKNICILNTEQLSRTNWLNIICKYHNDGIKCIDYSKGNINYFINKNISNILYLPYLINRNEIFNYIKINDIAFIGDFSNSQRRTTIINNLKLQNINININQIFGFDKKRDNYLFTHKILLNIHFNEDYKIFEQMRCNRCILNKMIIITEKNIDINYELKQYVIECDYDELISITIDVLKNYDTYHAKLFKNFNLILIEEEYLKMNDEFIKNLTTY